MSAHSLIEWTQSTWNPVTGCDKVSLGCLHCYAERLAKRLCKMGNPRYRNGFKVTLHPDLVDLPLKWRKPSMIFVNSMSDLYHEQVPFEFVQAIFGTMVKARRHTFQIVTKRAKRLSETVGSLPWPSNIWAGVSIEQQEYLWRVDELRKVPADIRFLSCEPLLGPLELDLEGIQWVIVGGESGPGARPMKEEWVRSIRDQCISSGVPLFFKQWGGALNKRGQEKALLDGELYKEWPEKSYGSPEQQHMLINTNLCTATV